jgi:vacuolar-type H+-ATPase subunit I/STV1
MNFYIFLSQIPANPSSLRVNVWRKLRAAGALGLQNGVWVLPKGSEQKEFLEGLLETIQQQGASGQIFTVTPLNEAIEQDILARFHNDRDEEYAEIQERSHEFLGEIEKETRKQKFTFAELEENEQDLQRLTSWFERIQKRDFIGGEKAQQAAEALEACRAAFEAFSTEVYNRQVAGSSLDSDEAK